MRILHLLDLSLPTISGYSSRSQAIVSAQSEAGLEPIVLTSPRFNNPSAVAIEYINDVKHYRCTTPRSSARFPLIEMNQFRRRVVDVARKEKIDLIHAHSPILTGIPGWLAARQLGLKCVYEMRSLWEDAAVEKGEIVESSLRYKAIRNSESFLMRRVDGVFCI